MKNSNFNILSTLLIFFMLVSCKQDSVEPNSNNSNSIGFVMKVDGVKIFSTNVKLIDSQINSSGAIVGASSIFYPNDPLNLSGFSRLVINGYSSSTVFSSIQVVFPKLVNNNTIPDSFVADLAKTLYSGRNNADLFTNPLTSFSFQISNKTASTISGICTSNVKKTDSVTGKSSVVVLSIEFANIPYNTF